MPPLVTPLDSSWQAWLDAIAAERRWPTSGDVRTLGGAVARLSDHYNRHNRAPDLDPGLQGARLGFFFPRDVPKGAGALRELIRHDGIAEGHVRAAHTREAPKVAEAVHSEDAVGPAPAAPLRVLDLGAGLGATTIGAVRALRAAGIDLPVHATAVDVDRTGLTLASRLASHVPGLTLKAEVSDVARSGVSGRYDLILLGQVLCELHAPLDPESRADAHAALLTGLLGHLDDRGTLVVIEPALREPSRHLHRVRDRLADKATIFAPCLHTAACPMLRRDADWCHEHLEVDLPPWLVPVAKEARLRWEGLTFAFLVLRKDGLRRSGRYRMVSEPLPSKGRRDLFLCGNFPEGPDRRKIGRLDRHRTEANAAWDELRRGDVIEAEFDGRIVADTRVTVTE